jgi:predicted dehydrogenase
VTVSLAVLSAAHGHCHAYAEAVDGIEGAEVVAVADEDDRRAREFATEHGAAALPAGEALARADGAVVCAANADHATWVRRAADAGVDVLCEKPLAPTAAEAEAMVDACADAGVSLGVAMPMRFSEPVRRARAALREGAVGDLQAVVGTNLLQKMAADTWFVDPERSGGGAVMDHSVHVVDLVRWLAGAEVREVYAETGRAFGDYPVEDVDVLSMELADGTPVTHDGSWRQPEEWEFWGDVTLRLIGTEGVYEVDCFAQTLTETTEGDGREAVYWGSDPDAGLVRDFVAAVREGRPPAIPGREGVREVRVVEAAYESAETGEPVTVTY